MWRSDCCTVSLNQATRSKVCVSLSVAPLSVVVGGYWCAVILVHFSSHYYSEYYNVVPSEVLFVIDRLLCFLIVGIHALGGTIPLSLLMKLGWSLEWMASLTLRMYQWESWSIKLTYSSTGTCPVSLMFSETAEFWVRASHISSSSSLILSFIAPPVSPMSTLPRSHRIL